MLTIGRSNWYGKGRLDSRSPGGLVAAALAGAWRLSPPMLESSIEELAEIIPQLLGSGAGALGWWRVRLSELNTDPVAFPLRQAYRFHNLQAALREHAVQQVVELLGSAGVVSVVVKGWTIARLYPESGLRPYGDIDLCVMEEQYALAETVLKSPEGRRYPIDLHHGFASLDKKRRWDELYAHSFLVRLGGVDVRVLSAEDHLRILCLHLLRHGAWRPLWLCDIAAALELRSAAFNWDHCLGENRQRADWVACVIGLVHQLLGVSVEDTPVAKRAQRLPRWLVPKVLELWGAPYPTCQAPMKYQAAMATYLRHPAGVLRDLRNRWPNPIEATISVNGPLNGLPRLPFQLAAGLLRGTTFLERLPRLLRE